jgi:hypothetical protein
VVASFTLAGTPDRLFKLHFTRAEQDAQVMPLDLQIDLTRSWRRPDRTNRAMAELASLAFASAPAPPLIARGQARRT